MIGRNVDGPLGAVLGRSHGLCGWSRVALKTSVGGPGPLSGPLWMVLGRFQGLGGWSWVALRASVGGPGPLSGPPWAVLGHDQAGKWPKPEREGELASGSKPKSSPKPSGKSIRTGNGPLLTSQASEVPYGFVL